MSAIELWPHQRAAIRTAREVFKQGRPSGLWAMPTGTGKTRAFASFAAELKLKTLVLVHREELVRQTVDAFRLVWPGCSVGIVKAEKNEWTGRNVVVASVQSLHERRLREIPRDQFGLIVVDEAHHAAAPTWRAVLQHFRTRFVLGVTATPERLDGQGLADLFGERPVYAYPLRRAIDDGRLVRLSQFGIRTDIDLSGVSYRAGDFAEGELAATVDTPERNQVVLEAYLKHARERRAIVFAVNVAHAEHLRDIFAEGGIVSACVTGATRSEDRENLLKDFATGKIQAMTNCAVLTEGFDDPGIGCVVMARPTTSRALYTQAVGRGLRLHPGKRDCLILDFCDNSKRHKLVTAMSLLGAPKSESAGGLDVLNVVDSEVRRAERAKEIASRLPLKWQSRAVSPWPELPDLRGYTESERWHADPASEKQLKFLASFGLDITRRLSKGEACFLISRALELDAAHPTPATPKQERFLRREGLWEDGTSKRDAQRIIACLVMSGGIAHRYRRKSKCVC